MAKEGGIEDLRLAGVLPSGAKGGGMGGSVGLTARHLREAGVQARSSARPLATGGGAIRGPAQGHVLLRKTTKLQKAQ